MLTHRQPKSKSTISSLCLLLSCCHAHKQMASLTVWIMENLERSQSTGSRSTSPVAAMLKELNSWTTQGEKWGCFLCCMCHLHNQRLRIINTSTWKCEQIQNVLGEMALIVGMKVFVIKTGTVPTRDTEKKLWSHSQFDVKARTSLPHC